MIFFWKNTPDKWLTRHDPSKAHWLACTLSTIQYLDMLLNVQLETHDTQGQLKACWGKKNQEGRWDIWEGADHKAGKQVIVNEKSFAPMFLYSHLAFKHALERLQVNARQSVSGVTTPEITQEGKALQWLQATMKVLAGAVENCTLDRSKLLQASFFIGKKDNEGPVIFRALVFSLDITAAFDADGTLGVVVFDDKNKGAGSAQTPALEARFRALKPPVLDEFTRLVSAVMLAAEKRMET